MANGFRLGADFTPGVVRVFDWTWNRTKRRDQSRLEAATVLLGLLAESECRAASLLSRHGIDAGVVQGRWPDAVIEPAPGNLPLAIDFQAPEAMDRFSLELQESLRLTTVWMAQNCLPLEIATEHLLWGLAAAEHELGAWLREKGLSPETLAEEILAFYGKPVAAADAEALSMPEDDSPQVSFATWDQRRPGSLTHQETPGDAIAVLRVIDAAANRGREGLRVIEDYVRFALDDRHLTERLKELRHGMTTALKRVPGSSRLAARETQADVGTFVTTETESIRHDARSVLGANFGRWQEALRSLEEFGKLFDPEMAAEFEQIRYQSYTLHRAIENTRSSLQRLEQASLYVLIDGAESLEAFESMVEDLIVAGVDLLQLRDKRLGDRELLGRARRLRELTEEGSTRFVMNDRADLAILARADGVHVGQEELSVKEVRSLVGPEMMIGVSTHSIEQARAAVLDGADYIGVGPTFESETKSFDHYPGVPLLREVAAEIRLPAFAIGGITLENVEEVRGAGFGRVAVSSAVTGVENATEAAVRMKAALRKK